ncbi:hypothetical protein Pst134EA_026820 [Puccinia striiformis f. sp. tritici]|uniref:hypothetical protein n=1 Tax=Puccinia striiformis f. sp. tritici TaxID=168172 RepID=UPI002007F315|nr:hypothetical protein Pst134EA_026820 [Puccinia striiformis f. sp. tritici]KAH9450110.1 hypothetical protein Pst134EA_026820 [Puccinia striiformis f. sp. tritici]
MISVRPRCDGCRRRDEECIPSSATRGDRTKCEGCRMRRVPCTTTYNSQNSTVGTDHANRRNLTASADRVRRIENNSTVRIPGVDYDIELIRDDFNIFAPHRRYTTCSPVPPPRYDEPDPIVLVETLVNRATTPPSREIPPTRRPPLYDQFERERVANEEARKKEELEKRKKEEEEEAKKKKEEDLKKKRDEERRQTLEGAIRRRENEAKKKEEENEAMCLRGEAIRRSVQEEVDRWEMDNRVPILEEEMNRSTIEEAGARIDSGGDYVMKEKNKEVETDARHSIQPKRSKKCRESKITDRFEKFYAMQLLILKKMGVYIDEEDIEEFKDLIKDINEGLVLLEEDIKKM